MYEDFYGFHEKPFNLTPDPSFLYLSEKHKEAFAHLLYGIRNRTGFIMVSGEIGTGKTTICRSLLSKLDDNTEIAFIFNPVLSAEELLRAINLDFGIESEARTVKDLIDELNEYLLKSNAEGRNCVLVIDEAQNLDPKVLEQVRLLSNLETETQKLLQIVLIGQPELHQLLGKRELRQLNQRITARYHLQALNAEETLHYVAFRLRVAGGRKKVRFTQPAVKKVYRVSGGTPRVINSICDRALLIGYTQETRVITPAIIKQAAREVKGEFAEPRQPFFQRSGQMMRAASAGIAGVLIAGLAALVVPEVLRAFPDTDKEVATPPRVTTVAQPRVVEAAPVPEPDRVATVAETEGVVSPVEEVVPVIPMDPIRSEEAFAASLADRSVNEMHHSAVRAILGVWDRDPATNVPPAGYESSFAAYVRGEGFTFTPRSATLENVRAVNLPVYAYFESDRGKRPAAILSATDDTYTLRFASQGPVAVAAEAVAERFTGDVVYLWIDPTPDQDNVLPWHRGSAVREVQKQLRALNLFAQAPNGSFDRATLNVVRDIQRATGLDVDGVVGLQTRMVLTSWDPAIVTPKLDNESTPKQFVVSRAPKSAPVQIEQSKPVAVAVVSSPPPVRGMIRQERRKVPETVPERVAAQAKATTGPIEEEMKMAPDPVMAVEELGEPEYTPLLTDSASGSQKQVTDPAADAVPLVPADGGE